MNYSNHLVLLCTCYVPIFISVLNTTDYINIGCDYCSWPGVQCTVCMRKNKNSALGGHLRWCKEYLETVHTNKRRALDPSVQVVVNNFTIQQAVGIMLCSRLNTYVYIMKITEVQYNALWTIHTRLLNCILSIHCNE